MSIFHRVSALFLLFLAVARASSETPKIKITQQSTLKELNQELKVFRDENPNMEPVEVNDYALAVLRDFGHLQGDIFSQIDKAIEEECYDFLKCFLPVSKWIWWVYDDDFALFLAKAFGRNEWMSEAEWEEYSKDVDWGLRFRVLVKSRNENIYESVRFKYLTLNNLLHPPYFKENIQEAYDSKDFALLSIFPDPSDDLFRYNVCLTCASFFWALTYGRVSGLKEGWNNYISANTPDEVLEACELFEVGNPEVFKCERVQVFLSNMEIEETLETAIEFDSLSYAQYLKEKLEPEEFQSMVTNCRKIHTRGRALQRCSGGECKYKYYPERLSQVYNFLLDNERDIMHDIKSIELDDVPILGMKHFKTLRDNGFSKAIPRGLLGYGDYTFRLYGETKAGIEFLIEIMKGHYMVNGVPQKIPPHRLANIKLEILDSKAISLIEDALSQDEYKKILEHFRSECIRTAVENGDTEYLAKVSFPPSSTSTKISELIFGEAIVNGKFKVLEWVLKTRPEWLEEPKWTNCYIIGNRPELPLLRYLVKKSSPRMPLAKYAEEHLQTAIRLRDRSHYDQVMAIEGITKVMVECEIKIPEFPQGSGGAPQYSHSWKVPKNTTTVSSEEKI